jgi:hypothetical protein
MTCNCGGAMCRGRTFKCAVCEQATPWCCGANGDERCDECGDQTDLFKTTAPRGATKPNKE